MYPKPVLTLSEQLPALVPPSSPGSTFAADKSSPLAPWPSHHHHHKQLIPSPPVQISVDNASQLYHAWLEYSLNVKTLRVGTIYECKLELPNTNYVRKKRIKLIYPSSKL